MPISLLNNATSLNLRRHLTESQDDLTQSLERLASGKRILRAGDDAAGLTLSDSLEGRVRSTRQAYRNTLDAISLTQTAEGAMTEVNNLLIRIRELAIQAASDAVGDKERELLEVESSELRSELERIAQSTTYLGTPLLNGQGRDLTFQIGPDNDEAHRIQYDAGQIDLRPDALGVDDVDLSDSDEARDSLEVIDEAIARVGNPRAKLGAIQTRLHSITQQNLNQEETLVAAKSRILDADLALEASEALRNQVKLKASTAVMAQANMLPGMVLRLLEG